MFKNKNEANRLLRYAILISQGKGFNCPFKNTRFSLILSLKRDLEKMGAKWQVKTLNYWIHRFMRDYPEVVLQNPSQKDFDYKKQKRGGV